MKQIKALRIKSSLLFLLIIFIPLTAGMAQGYFPDATLQKPMPSNQVGRVKFREDWVYKYGEGKMSPIATKIGYERFDTLGLKIEEAKYDMLGKALLEVTYSYDEWGRESQCLGLRASKSFYRKWAYEYIDTSKCLVKGIHNNPSNQEKWVYKFDKDGNIIEETSIDEKGEVLYRYEIKYTPFKMPSELIEYSGTGTMYEKWIYIYNKQNQNIEVLQFGASKELYKKYINKFDEFGNQMEIITLDQNEKELERTISVYQFYK